MTIHRPPRSQQTAPAMLKELPMSERRRALGRGLGALIPSGPPAGATSRPVDVFFPETPTSPEDPEAAPPAADTDTDNTGLGKPVATQTKRPAPTNGATVSGTGKAEEDDGDLRPVPGARFAEVPLSAIQPNPRQPREVFDEDELDELASSIREVGVLQPVVVRPRGTDADGDPQYELIMGERRWRDSQHAGASTVPAIIRDTDADDMLRDALLENLHRRSEERRVGKGTSDRIQGELDGSIQHGHE